MPKKAKGKKSTAKQSQSQHHSTQQQAKAPQPVRKVRTALWAVLIVLIGVHGILTAVMAYSSMAPQYKDNLPIAIALFTLASLAAVVAAVAMWFWKRWGIILYLLTVCVAAAVHILLTGSLLFVFVDLFPVLIVGYTLKLQNLLRFYE